MSDRDRTDENQPASDQPAPPEPPEGGGGPWRRHQAFIQERAQPLRERTPEPGASEEETPSAPWTLAPEDEPAMEAGENGEAPELPPSFRQKLIREYRNRQREHLQAEGRAPAPPGARPAAPVPPPQNNWIPIGPSVLRRGQGAVLPATSGRTTGLGIAPGGSRVYIGAANGGVWRSEDTGDSWASLMDAWDLNPNEVASDSLACGALALVAGASPSLDRVYVGSGEGSGAAYFGVGPIVSFDGGANWATENVAPGSTDLAGSGFYRLAVDPFDPDRVVAATRVGLYRREPDGSGGMQWAQKTVGGATDQRITSVAVAHSGAVPATYFAVRQDGPVYTSQDGHTWVQAGNGFPGSVGRVSLAVRPDDPTVVYAFTSAGALWRLDTNDGTWRQVTGIPAANSLVRNQGWYDLAIAVAPNNVNQVYLGGATVSSGGEWSGALYRCQITAAGTNVTATFTYIGASIHADIHTIDFPPGDATEMWVGCDGGVFHTTTPTGTGNIFTSRNTGLATLTMNHIGQHPTEDAVVFCGTQDNGGVRFTGEEAWLYSSHGDAGFAVVNWNDPYRVLSSYTGDSIRRSTDGGTRGSYVQVSVPTAATEAVLFYAPLVGTPPNPAAPAEADIVAFGSDRPWISTDFASSWLSIPNNALPGDRLAGPIRSMIFQSADKLYAGTFVGWVFVNGGWVQYTSSGVYRFDRSGTTWTRTRLDTMGGSNSLPLDGTVTDIAVDYSDPSGNSIYLAFGGNGDYRHVWHFDGAQWAQRSGPSAGDATALLDVQHNAVVTDPTNPNSVYAASDIGVWRSTDGGANWSLFEHGLPDAAVLDLKLHDGRRVLRAATHGRGVFERTLDSAPKAGVELYVRDTQLDQGRFLTQNYLPDPTQQGATVGHWAGPDIKLDTPDVTGQYEFPPGSMIDFREFVDELTDDSKNVATHATATITTRVYVQVHNRGVVPANNVRVMLLLANASAGLPSLPAGYEVSVKTSTPINTADWQTIGIATVDDIRVGFPRVAAFDLTSDKLPPPAMLTGNNHHCVLALIHSPDDQYLSTETNTDLNSRQERKAAHKNLTVVQFTGTLPAPPPIVMPIRLNNGDLEREALAHLEVSLNGYPGRVRVVIPELRLDGDLERSIKGLSIGSDSRAFATWSDAHLADVESQLADRASFNKLFSIQRMEAVRAALAAEIVLEGQDRDTLLLHGIHLEPAETATVFLLLDRPDGGRVGDVHRIEVSQRDANTDEVTGALSARVELQPEPEVPECHVLKLWERKVFGRLTVLSARLHEEDGTILGPKEGATVRLSHSTGRESSIDLGEMRWYAGGRYFYALVRGAVRGTFTVTAYRNNREVTKDNIRM